jgi:hypothetical protein
MRRRRAKREGTRQLTRNWSFGIDDFVWVAIRESRKEDGILDLSVKEKE